jgi:hypothetical protein
MRTPDDSPCWNGDWHVPDPAVAIWSQSAVARTVRALPELHPLRLGDAKGTSGRVMAWCGSYMTSTDQGGLPHAIGVLTQLVPEPDLGDDVPGAVAGGLTGDDQGGVDSGELLYQLVTGLPRGVADAVADAVAPPPRPATQVGYRRPDVDTRRWAGAIAQIPDCWLPPVALLPRELRDLDDPGTRWSTESVDFAARLTVHSHDVRLASDLLAPHVMALVLDEVPSDAAVTLYGDALHIWWDYDRPSRLQPGLVARVVETATDLVASLPSFVLSEYPDHSQQVEDRLAARAADAAAYRAAREAQYAARRRQHGL